MFELIVLTVAALFFVALFLCRVSGHPRKVAKWLAEMPNRELRKKERLVEEKREILWEKAAGLLRGGAEVAVIVCKDYSDSWSQDGRYLPVGHDHEVLPQSYCVVGKNCPATWDALPEKLRGLDLEELNAKCRYVYEDQETQLVRDGWGNWRFVRRDGKLLLVWQLTGYGELERRERESERRRQEDLFQSACMD